MKTILLISLTILSLSSFAADLAQEHERLCTSEEAKAEMGEKGSCRIVMGQSDAQYTQGVCIGKFKNVMPCKVTYAASAAGAAMQLLCGFDFNNPSLDQIIRADASAYTVIAVVTKENDLDVIINDNGIHTLLDSNIMSLSISKYETSMSGKITLNMKAGPVELTEVQCN